MFRYLLSSKAIFAGLIFFFAVVGGSLFYSWHVQRTTGAGLAQPLKNDKETHTPADTVETSTVDHEHAETPRETDNTQVVVPDTAALPSDDGVPVDPSDVFLSDDFVSEEEEPTEDVPVSPYGFGPYPEVPNGFPFIPTWLWPEASRQKVEGLMDHELRFRVMIKLWNEGDTRFTGTSINPDTSMVHPSYPNTVYLRYREDGMGGKTVLVKSGPGVSEEDVAQIIDGNTPPGIRILDYDTDGIDPYTYLDLPSN